VFEETKAHQTDDYVFRGQHNAMWRLDSSLSRQLKRVEPSRHYAIRYNHFKRIVERAIDNSKVTYEVGRTALQWMAQRHANPLSSAFAKPEMPRTPIQDVVEVWSVAQHFRAPTPLLDWSRSLYTAIFFAYHGHRSEAETGRCAVYALNRKLVQELSDREVSRGEHGQGGLFFAEASGRYNERIRVQNGLFSISWSDKPVEQWVTAAAREPEWNERPVLLKFELPAGAHEARLAIEFLRPYGVHVGQLFPDFEGHMMHATEELRREISP
jgi:hypothetical protein